MESTMETTYTIINSHNNKVTVSSTLKNRSVPSAGPQENNCESELISPPQIACFYGGPPVSSSASTTSTCNEGGNSNSRQQPRNRAAFTTSKGKSRPDKHSDLSKFQLKPKIPEMRSPNVEISMEDICAAQHKLCKPKVDEKFWEDMYDLLMEAFTSKYKSLNTKPKFLGIIETVLFALVAQRGNSLNNLKRMRRYLTFERDAANDSIRIKSSVDVAKTTELQENITKFCYEDKAAANLMEHNILPFFSMTEILQNISAPENIAFTEWELLQNFPMPIKSDKNRKVQAVRVKLHKPTLVHLIKIHVKSPWKVGHEDSQKIVASLTEATDNQWMINEDIVVHKPETGDKDVFSILYKNPITKIDVCKNYNVVLIDRLYLVGSKNNEKRLDVITSPMRLTNGDTPIVGFNLHEPDEAMKQKRKIELDHVVLDTPKTKKRKLN